MMMTYDTYKEAKIANPENNIYPSGDRFVAFKAGHAITDKPITGTKCNPADYCMSLSEFFNKGHKLVDGDAIINQAGELVIVGSGTTAALANHVSKADDSVYVVKAAALEPDPEEVDKVMWENGDRCVHELGDAIFASAHPINKESHCIIGLISSSSITQWLTARFDEIEKPETPDQKAAREELEAAFDLYREFCGEIGDLCDFDLFKKHEYLPDSYIRIVRKTNYKLNKSDK